MINLFAYGSLMCADIMQLVCGQSCKSSDAHLSGYFRSKLVGETYPAIRPQSGGRVEGVIYFDLGPEAVSRLDAFEGIYYSRESIIASTLSGEQIRAMTYVIVPEYQHLMTEKAWSFDEFSKSGKEYFMDQYVGFYKVPGH